MVRQHLQVLVDYRDLAGRTYSTSATFVGLRIYDVRFFEEHAVTHHGDAVYPQSGLRDVSPAVTPSLRERLRRAWRGLRGHVS